ncbi:MAG TPA: hypothetical protein VKT70_02950, partial [Stellaceae bacterium]|nr:hypothetical protein [Stellaceae bacterium]
PWARALALAASLAVVALHIAGARYFRLPPWYGLLFPVGYTLACLLALTGFVKRLRGDVTWKGRHYPAD